MPMKSSAPVSARMLKQLDQRLVGASNEIRAVRELIVKVAHSDATVLIQGESGTGKEVVAKLVHDVSSRAKEPFIAINCGAIPSELLESELFGHEKGSFTGAVASRKGRFEMAEGGTLFLDEIGDMPFAMQVKLLRVLQERSFERVGGIKSIQCNVRIIAATHQDLESKIENKLFRSDLYYRLSIFPIDLPPLRSRSGDVAVLIESFTDRAKRHGEGSLEIAADAIKHLNAYAWPGNVRELSNLVERLMVLYPNQLVGESELPQRYLASDLTLEDSATGRQLDLLEANQISELFAPIEPLSTDGSVPVLLDAPIDLKTKLADLERDFIIAALDQTDWVTAHAANWLKLQRTTLVEKMRKYDIKR